MTSLRSQIAAARALADAAYKWPLVAKTVTQLCDEVDRLTNEADAAVCILGEECGIGGVGLIDVVTNARFELEALSKRLVRACELLEQFKCRYNDDCLAEEMEDRCAQCRSRGAFLAGEVPRG
jgi:hypothetical protein